MLSILSLNAMANSILTNIMLSILFNRLQSQPMRIRTAFCRNRIGRHETINHEKVNTDLIHPAKEGSTHEIHSFPILPIALR